MIKLNNNDIKEVNKRYSIIELHYICRDKKEREGERERVVKSIRSQQDKDKKERIIN